LAKFSKPFFRMTNEKFSMTNFQFRFSALVAASAAPSRSAFALRNGGIRGKMLAKRRAAGLGCGNLKAAIADNGNEPLLHGKRPGRNWFSADRRENTASTVPRRTCCDMRQGKENPLLCGTPSTFVGKGVEPRISRISRMGVCCWPRGFHPCPPGLSLCEME
jgi:hypothetical protein